MHSTQCHKMKWRHKLIKNKQYPWRNDNNFRSQYPKENENWEKEIAEYACTSEFKDQPPYADSGDELNTTEMISCDVQNSTNLNHQDYYSPAVHHTHPVKWVRYIYAKVANQFSDAEE
ncbi:hypothetical protein IRJ41_013265 [Triplophysa rosa]|uniref:Uncharacterized protein n=1 Tax=Triplophysa rosa TaxID=992332 RepID=A0A9W7WTD0_TRIRA|nr:hypothetical protein IRJ41_013265 [Triplophysa rosa]